MKVIILDASLADYGSHGFNYCKSITDSLTSMDVDYSLFANSNVDQRIVTAIGAAPHFTNSIYEGRTQDRTIWQTETWSELNGQYFEDLRNLPAPTWDPANIILFPAVNQNQILGICKWLAGFEPGSVPRSIIQLMFYPTWTAWGWDATLGPSQYKHALASVSHLLQKKIFLCSENQETARVYERLIDTPVHVLPVPSMKPIAAGRRSEATSPVLYVGVFGYSKFEKGIHLVPEAVALCRRRNLPVRFIVQFLHGGWEPEVEKAEEELRRSEDAIIVSGSLDTERYYPLLEFCDILALPYDPDKYRERGSSVFSESVVYAKPIVASKGTWMSSAAERGECAAVIFDDYNSESLADAIATAVEQFAPLKTFALTLSDKWFSVNNGVSYCQTVFKVCGLEAPNVVRSLPPRGADQYPPYVLGTWVEFSPEDIGALALGPGWSFPEKKWRWIEGKNAKLFFRMPEAGERVELRVWASRPDVRGKTREPQTVGVFLNERRIGEFHPGVAAGEHEVMIPEGSWVHGLPSTLEFRSERVYQGDLGGRELSCCLYSMCFRER